VGAIFILKIDFYEIELDLKYTPNMVSEPVFKKKKKTYTSVVSD